MKEQIKKNEKKKKMYYLKKVYFYFSFCKHNVEIEEKKRVISSINLL